MSEWTEEQLMDQGYYTEPDPKVGEQSALRRRIDANAAHRESMLPCSRSAGQPLAPKEPVPPQTELDRLFLDQDQIRGVLEARKAAGL